MSVRIRKSIVALMATPLLIVASSRPAKAQQPVVVNTVTPAVVGYAAERAGLFGLRTRIRPIVAPYSTPVAVMSAPVQPVTVLRPASIVRPVAVRPVTVVVPRRPVAQVVARPVVPAYYVPAPAVAPVTFFGY